MRVRDVTGLNDRLALELLRSGSVDVWSEMTRRLVPEYLAGDTFEPPEELRDNYVLAARFERTSRHTKFQDWNLWARKDSAALARLAGEELPQVFPAR
jgi:hypothetical protein